MITIDQLLESVDLDFEPRFITKDSNGVVHIWSTDKVEKRYGNKHIKPYWTHTEPAVAATFTHLKLSEFENKDWEKCFYKVPRKTTGKIERLTNRVNGSLTIPPMNNEVVIKINELVDMVNNIISVQEKMIDSRFIVDAANELKGE